MTDEVTRERATRSLQHLTRTGEGAEDLMPLVYERLRDLAGRWYRGQPAGATLQATALVHEAYLHLIDQNGAGWKDRVHFFAVAATAMRQLLIQRARKRQTLKRGDAFLRVELDAAAEGDTGAGSADLLHLDEALDKLAKLHARQARLVELRFFGGLSVEEAAEVLDVSKRTAELDWRAARAWLRGALEAPRG